MFERLLEQLAKALEDAGFPYMIIGGQAVLVHGEPRITRDIDITLGADLDRLPDVLRLIQAIPLTPLVAPETFTKQTMVLPCRDPGTSLRVDLIFSNTPYERQAMTRVKKHKIGNIDVHFASVEDLLIHKVMAGRPRDLDDARSVLLKNPKADVTYIRKWLRDLSAALDQPLVARFDQLLEEIT
jgi:predicted nucleotidyltransferase